MASFEIITRSRMRGLAAGETLRERGIEFTRLANGDGRWAVNVMVNRVRRHRIVGNESEGYTRTQAEQAVAEIKAGKREAQGRRVRIVTVREAARAYLEHLVATGGRDVAKKRQRLELHLLPAIGHIMLPALTQRDLRAYATTRQRAGASPATVNRELAVMSHLLRLAADPDELGLLQAQAFRIQRLKEPESKPVYLKPDQARALLAAAEADGNEHIVAFCMVGLHTGMRYEPILRIRHDEIDIERRIIWVDRDKAGERQQPITGVLADFLAEYMLSHSGPWLFPSPSSRSGRATNVYKAFRRVVAAAGLPPNITPHKLRHTMATNAAHAGIDAATLQAMGGWKSRRMVERYTHAGTLADAMDRLQGAYSATAHRRRRAGAGGASRAGRPA